MKDALSDWLLRELDRSSTIAVDANKDGCGQGKDIAPDGGSAVEEPGTGSDDTVVENTPKSPSIETSKPVESKCPALLSCQSRCSPALLGSNPN